MKHIVAALLLTVLVSLELQAQTTLYWKKDHVHGPGGEIAVITPPPSDSTAPTAPSGLSAVTVRAASVDLTWTGSSDTGSGLLAYKIYRQKGSGASLPVGVVNSSTTGFTDHALEPNTGYSWVIVAVDNAQNHSLASSGVTATTAASSTDTVAPDPPVQVAGTVLGPYSVQLTWLPGADAGGSGIGSYQIKRGGSVVDTVSGTTLTYTDTGLNQHTNYSWTVVTRDNASTPNVSGNSNSVSLTTAWETTPPTAPASVSGDWYDYVVVLSWSAGSDTGGSLLAGYNVYYKGDGYEYLLNETPVTTTSFDYDFTGWSFSDYQGIAVRSVDGAGNISTTAAVFN